MDFKNSGDDYAQKDWLQGRDLSDAQAISRPPCAKLNPAVDDIEFMQIDIDYYTAVQPCK